MVNLQDGATLKDLNAAIEDVEFIPADMQRVVKGSTALTDGCLDEILFEADTVDLTLPIAGGMRAKWRKKRMRRLQRKRRRMRQRSG